MTPPQSYRGRRVLVTGAAGFVGANTCAALRAEGAEVHAVVRTGGSLWRLAEAPTAEVHEVDLARPAEVLRTMTAVRPERVFHLAAYSAYHARPDEQMRIRVDVGGTLALLQGAAEIDCRRFVCAGSSLEYGTAGRAFSEEDPPRPVTHRGVTKAASTLAVQRDAMCDGRPNVVLRFFSVYGPWEHPHRLVPSAVRAALTGAVLPLTRPGLQHDFVYVGDVVEALLRAGLEPAACGEVINVGSGRGCSNEGLVDLVEEATGRTIRRNVGAFPAQPCDKECWVADVRKAARVLDWHPTTTLSHGLALSASWWGERPALLGPDS